MDIIFWGLLAYTRKQAVRHARELARRKSRGAQLHGSSFAQIWVGPIFVFLRVSIHTIAVIAEPTGQLLTRDACQTNQNAESAVSTAFCLAFNQKISLKRDTRPRTFPC